MYNYTITIPNIGARMNRKKILILFSLVSAFVIFGIFTQNCSKNFNLASNDSPSVNPSNDSSFVAPETVATLNSITSNLRYFGFFADAMQGAGIGNYIDSTSMVANIHFISGDTPNLIAGKVRQAKNQNNKAVLMLENHIFNWQTVELQANYVNNLSSIYGELKIQGLLDTVLGIYVIDEPYLKNKIAKSPLTEQQVFNGLKIAADAILNTFGTKVILASEAYPIIDDSLSSGSWLAFPENYNWLAVNCYLAFGSVCDTNEKYEKYVSTLASHLNTTKNQHMFLTIDNYWNSDAAKTTEIQRKLITRVNFQVELAKKYNAVALVSFLYQSVPAENLFGLVEMPNLKDYVFGIAALITGKNIPAPIPIPTPPPAASLICGPQQVLLSCKVDGVSKNVYANLNSTKPIGGIESSNWIFSDYQINYAKYSKFNLQWTCNTPVPSGPQWVFSHPEGFCEFSSLPKASVSNCNPQEVVLTCKINGAVKNAIAMLYAAGPVGSIETSNYVFKDYQVDVSQYSRFILQWTCNANHQWQFSDPNGFCEFSTR